MDYKKSYKLFCILLYSGLAISIPSLFLDLMVPFYIGAVMAAAGIIQRFLFCHCPYCGKVIDIRGGAPEHCKHCGMKLEF